MSEHRSHVTTHVLDAVSGRPAVGIVARLQQLVGDVWETVADGRTDEDGRIGDLGPQALEPGGYRIWFGVGDYFDAAGVPTFYPEVTITFDVSTPSEHYHVPLLLSPYAYSTYRGS